MYVVNGSKGYQHSNPVGVDSNGWSLRCGYASSDEANDYRVSQGITLESHARDRISSE
jgi:hypothetical protein